MRSDLMPLRVAHRQAVASDIHLFELRHPDGAELPAFTAGAHIPVQTPCGAMRQYSLCNAPQDSHCYQIAVKREAAGRGGSASMVDALQVGDLLNVGAPENLFPLDERASRFILIAGGIGITPMLAMARQLLHEQRPWRLYYLSRTPEHTAFLDVLQSGDLAPHVKIHHDHGDPQKGFDLWPVLEKPGSPAGAHVYCCGPTGLMDAVRDMTGHWPGSTVHFESFGSGHSTRDDDRTFSVHFSRSGQQLQVPAGQTILDIARQHGIHIPSSCESGSCGSCKTRLLSGEADHRDLVLLPEEKAQWIMPCVSRALGDQLSLDA